MAIKTAHDLFVSQLRDIYSAEKQAVRVYPKIAKATRSEELKTALHEHLEQKKGQIARLDRVFEILDKKSSSEKCEAMKGLVEEAHKAVKDISKGPVLDAAIVAAGQRIAHYEIASYGTVAAFADAMGHTDIQELLAATLGEEKAADERLSDIARAVNAQSVPTPEPEEIDGAVSQSSRNRPAKASARKRSAAKPKS